MILDVVSLFYEINFFEFGESYVWVEEFEFWGGVVFFEFGFLIFSGYGREGVGDWFLFGDV